VAEIANQPYGLIINNSNFSQNSAISQGGVLYLQNDFILISNSIFQNNSALQGGVIFFDKPCNNLFILFVLF